MAHAAPDRPNVLFIICNDLNNAIAGMGRRPCAPAPDHGSWDGPPGALTSVRGDTGIHHSGRSLTYRYTLCGNGEGGLYDHRAEPHEWHDLASDERHAGTKRELRAELMRLMWNE